MVEKAKEVPLELPLPKKIIEQNQYCIYERTSEISVTIKDLKDAGVGVPLHPI